MVIAHKSIRNFGCVRASIIIIFYLVIDVSRSFWWFEKSRRYDSQNRIYSACIHKYSRSHFIFFFFFAFVFFYLFYIAAKIHESVNASESLSLCVCVCWRNCALLYLSDINQHNFRFHRKSNISVRMLQMDFVFTL